MCCTLLCSGIYLMHKHSTWSAGQKDHGNQKKKDEECSCVQDVGKICAPAYPESAQLSLGSQNGLGSDAMVPSLCHSGTVTFLSPGTFCSTDSCLCWVRSS